MANNRFQFKRTSTSGLLPNTTNSANNSYIAAGEFAVNLTDKKVVSSNGTATFEVGANLNSLYTTGNITLANNNTRLIFSANSSAAGNISFITLQDDNNFVFYNTATDGAARPIWSIFTNSNTAPFNVLAPTRFNSAVQDASGSNGVNGYVLTSNGTAVNWAPAGSTSGLAAGDGLGSNTTHYFVRANTGIIANTTGMYVDPTYIATLDANNTTYLGGVNLTTLQSQITSNAATAYTNATAFAANASNINTGTLPYAQLPANVVIWSNTNTFTANQTFGVAAITSGNATSFFAAGTGTANGKINATAMAITVNATASAFVNSTAHATTNGTAYSNVTVAGFQTSAGSVNLGNTAANTVANSTFVTLNANSVAKLFVNTTAMYIGTNASNYNLTNSSSMVLVTAPITATVNTTTFSLSNSSFFVNVGTTSIATSATPLLIGNTAANAVVNTTQVTVSTNSTVFSFINATSFSGTANDSLNLSGTSLGTLQTQITGNSATAYSNAVADAATDATTKAATAYSNAVATAASDATTKAGTAYTNATVFASNASNINSGTLAFARLPANAVFWSNTNTFTAPQTFNANLTIAGNTTAQLIVGTAADGVDANSSSISVGNATVFTTINSTSFSGTSNNSINLGGSSLATVQGQITGNAATAYTNAVAAAASDATTKAGTAYTNGVAFASNASNINTGTLAEARLPYRMDQNVATTSSVQFTNIYLTGNLTVGSNVNVIGANNYSVTDNMIYLNANATYANPDIGISAGYNNGTYAHAGFFRDHITGIWKVFDGYLPEPDASIYIDQTNSSFKTANFMANVYYVGNNTVYATVNSTIYSGTANNATNLGGSSLATIQGQITGNAATAYTNAVAAAASDATTKAGTAYTNATVFASNASNINSGTLAFARLPANAVFWSNTNTFTAPQTFNANTTIAGNATAQLIVGSATDGVNVTSTTINVGNSTVFTTVNSTAFSGTANNSTNLGGSSLATVQSQITGNAATAYSNAVANAAALYQTTAGLSANVATLTANAATYVGNSSGTIANITSWITANSSTAYTNAIAVAANATNLTSGTVNPARLGSGTANSTTVLYGNGVWSTVSSGATLVANTTDPQTFYFPMTNSTSGAWTNGVVDTTLTFVPSTGTLTTETIVESSSIRIKENVVELQYSTTDVMKLRPVRYNKIGKTVEEIGLIAEEVAEVIPEVISYDFEQLPAAVNYGRLVTVLISSIQQQQSEIEDLKYQVNELRQEINNKN